MGTQIGRSSFLPLLPEAIKEGERLGSPFICTMCSRWSSAYMRKVYNVNFDGSFDDLTCGVDCFGPAIGGVFDSHEGPLRDSMIRYCYICGRHSDAFIEGGDEDWCIGVCNCHLDELSDLLPQIAMHKLFSEQARGDWS